MHYTSTYPGGARKRTKPQFLICASSSMLARLWISAAGYLLTQKGVFLDRDGFCRVVAYLGDASEHVDVPVPAVVKPARLWTGKQVISTLLAYLADDLPGLNLDSSCKIKQKLWGSNKDSFPADFSEQKVCFRDNELLRGVLDKSQFGASKYQEQEKWRDDDELDNGGATMSHALRTAAASNRRGGQPAHEVYPSGSL